MFCAGGSVVHPHVALHRRPCEIYHQTLRSCDKDQPDLRSCVLEFAKCAETLTVAASLKNANRILLDDSIIKELQQSIRHLTILSFHGRQSISVMRKVAKNLVRDGAVHELCVGNCSLSSGILTELLEFGAVDCSCSVDASAGGSSEARCQINDDWTQDAYDSLADSTATDNQGSLSDLYDVALQPCGADLKPSSSVACRRCSAPSSFSEGTGLRSLKLVNLKLTSGSIDTVLSDVLPRLCQLEKLAVVGLAEMNTKRTATFSKASHYLCTQIQCGQLSHVILDGCFLPSDFLSLLLSALFRRCRYVFILTDLMYCIELCIECFHCIHNIVYLG